MADNKKITSNKAKPAGVFSNKPELILFLKMFFATIILHWIIMFLGYVMLCKSGDKTLLEFFPFFREKFMESGDTPHYLYLAENWYQAAGEKANLIVFYPLYPLLMKIVGFVVRDYFTAGVLISNVCLGVSGYYMYKLIHGEAGEEGAYDGWAIYVLYPFGAFMVLVFTESLSMMLVVMCLYYIKKNKWVLAGILGLLAAVSKSQCIALLVPAVYEAVVYMVRKKKFDVRCLGVIAIPFGTFAYFLINKIVQGDFFAFVAHEEAAPWYNKSQWIADNLTQHYGMAQDYFGLSLLIYWIQIILYFAVIILLFYGLKKKVSPSLIAFGGAYMFISYLHGWLISGPRYMMGCVTIYIVCAVIPKRSVRIIILLLFGLLNIFYTLGIWQGQAIM